MSSGESTGMPYGFTDRGFNPPWTPGKKIYPTPETTPPEERVWEAPDERIKWALELLEPKVPLKETLSDRYFAPAFGSSMMFGLAVFHNYTMRQPIFKSNILILAGSAVTGYFVGESWRRFTKERIEFTPLEYIFLFIFNDCLNFKDRNLSKTTPSFIKFAKKLPYSQGCNCTTGCVLRLDPFYSIKRGQVGVRTL